MGQFWSEASVEPKRQFRWLLSLPVNTQHGVQAAIETYAVRSVNKPTFTVGEQAVNYLAHTYKYPGRFTWSDVNVTLVDLIAPDQSGIIAEVLRSSGYRIPDGELNSQFSFSKKDAVTALGTPVLTQIDAGNPMKNQKPVPVEKWTLINAWLKEVKFGDTLNYTSEELVEVSLTISYDWAEYDATAPGTGQLVVPILTHEEPPV